MASPYSVEKLMSETRRLAAEFKRTTGKPLAVSGEIARFDAINLLGLQAAEPGHAYDAVQGDARILIKGRAIFDESKGGHRLGQLKLDSDWDYVVLVLMDEQFNSVEIYQASKDELQSALIETANRRGTLSVAKFKAVAKIVWDNVNGLVDEVWDNKKGLK